VLSLKRVIGTPEMFPDMSGKATLDLWRTIFDLAQQIWQMAPWTLLSRSALIGVEEPHTGDVGFVSVTDDPAFPTISIYREAMGLYGFLYNHDMPLPDYPEQYLEIPQIQIEFKSRDSLDERDLKVIAQLGLTNERTATFPVIRSVQPGFRPWYLHDDEVSFLLCVLEQAVEVLPRAMLNPDLLAPQMSDRFPMRVRDEDSLSWRDDTMRIPQPGAEPIIHMMDHELFAKVQQLPHSNLDVETDFFLVIGIPPHASEAGQRPRYPHMLTTVDARLGMILHQEILRACPTLEAMIGLLGWQLVVTFDKLGAIPRTVIVRSPILAQVFASFSQTLGFELKETKELPGVDAAKAILRRLIDLDIERPQE